jgi:hypothetical protein
MLLGGSAPRRTFPAGGFFSPDTCLYKALHRLPFVAACGTYSQHSGITAPNPAYHIKHTNKNAQLVGFYCFIFMTKI